MRPTQAEHEGLGPRVRFWAEPGVWSQLCSKGPREDSGPVTHRVGLPPPQWEDSLGNSVASLQ